MGFIHQLKLLLWKNFTLKKRSPIIVTFELVIPLVLFLILICIRVKKPSQPRPQVYFEAQPLPSSGIIPMLQSFCPDGERDPYGFPNYPNSMVHQFLTNIRTVVTNNKLFDRDFTINDIKILPYAFKDVINDHNSVEERFATANDFTIGSVLKNESRFYEYMVHNLSLPEQSVDNLLKYNVNPKEVYRILYGVHPEKADDKYDPKSGATTWSLKRWIDHRLAALKYGIMYQNVSSQEHVLTRDQLIGILSQALTPNGVLPDGLQFNQTQYANDVKNKVTNTEVLHMISCKKNEAYKFLEVPTAQRNSTDSIRIILCEKSPAVVNSIVQELRQELDPNAIADKLNLSSVNMTYSRTNVARILFDLQKYAVFEKTVREISFLAALLPNDACPGNSNKSDAPYQHVYFNDTDTDIFTGNLTEDYFQIDSMNGTQEHLPDDIELLGLNAESDKVMDEKTQKLVKLYKVWGSMQNILCGINRTVDEGALDQGDLEAAGFTKYQERNLQVMMYLLFSNPKILYAPNTTDVNDLIHRASGMLRLVQNITVFAETWLNISSEIREHFKQNTTRESYQWLRQMTLEFKEHPELLTNLTVGEPVEDLITNGAVPDIALMIDKLDIIDNAACAWIEVMSSKTTNDVFKPFRNETELVDYTLKKAYADNVTVFASLVFEVDEHGKLPLHVVYKIRQNSSFTGNTNMVRSKYWVPGHNHNHHFITYYQFAFVMVQDVIERAIIDKRVGRNVVEPGSYVQEFPYPCFIKDSFLFVIEHMFPIVMIISWVYYVAMLTQSVVYEKEQRLKEVMKMMGLSNAVHWIAWFITSFSEMSITVAILVFILKYGEMLTYSDPVIVWIFLSIFGIATIMFCFMVSVLFSKAKLAAASAGILYFISYVPYLYIALREEVAGESIPITSKSIASMLSTTAFGLGAKYFALYEEEGVGLQWSNFGQSPLEQDDFNLMHIVLIMIGDAVLYGVLTWYIEAVHPGSYGLPRPWYFPFQKSYWFGHGSTESTQMSLMSCFRRNTFTPLSVMEEDQACAMAAASQDEEGHYIEDEPIHLPLGVCIDRLCKVYKNSTKLAVNKLSLNFYEGQITSFLGHNGAGKTTTMSILTGLIPPTSGTAVIYGHDIRTDMLQIRQSLGMCPQHNALFDKLTVEEHVWFYASLKESSSSDIQREMDVLIKDIGLLNKRNSKVETLSGGMQRKLSVAIAFVGGSQTVILDEPTAGVDPYARRAIWDLLLKYKRGRTIILSTHHMDEADMLGDRIAIIANGQLKCCGSSLFLKSTFGEGYKLTVAKKASGDSSVTPNTSMENLVDFSDPNLEDSSDTSEAFRQDMACGGSSPEPGLQQPHTSLSLQQPPHRNSSQQKLTEFLQKHIPGTKLVSEHHHELAYMLPSEAAKKGCFEKMFDNLNENLDDFGVSSYGIMDTSLEEVFLKVAQSSNVNTDPDEKEHKPNETMNTLPTEMDMSPMTSPQSVSASSSPLRNILSLSSPFTSSPQRSQSSSSRSQSSIPQGLNLTPRNQDIPCLLKSDESSISQSSPGGHSSQRGQGSPLAKESASTASALGVPSPKEVELSDVTDGQGAVSTDSDISLDEVYNRQQGELHPLMEHRESEGISEDNSRQAPTILEGKGSYTLSGFPLTMTQFGGLILKRFHHSKRNWKGLFSQLILPAIFVCIAMSVALLAPQVGDYPPLILSPSQYHSLEYPEGNYVPYTDEARFSNKNKPMYYRSPNGDAGPAKLLSTFQFPAGIGASCILREPYNRTVDQMLEDLNYTMSEELIKSYFDDLCIASYMPQLDDLMESSTSAPFPHDLYQEYLEDDYGDVYVHNETFHIAEVQCVCAKNGHGFLCPDNVGEPQPPIHRVVTGDKLQDVSGRNLSEYILYTSDKFKLHRYGAITVGNVRPNVPPDFDSIVPSIYRKLAVRNAAIAWHNHKGFHSMPTFLNALNNAVLRANLDPRVHGNPSAYGITVINHPMNKTDARLSTEYILQGTDVVIAIFIIVALSFVPASFVVFLVSERASKAKHLQFVSGVNPVVYWASNYTWDILNYFVPATCCIGILLLFDVRAYTSPTNLPAVILLFLLYGWSFTPMMYPASFFFEVPSTAYVFLIVINLFVGITTVIAAFFLQLFSDDKELKEMGTLLNDIFVVFPNYCLGRGLMDVAYNDYFNEYYYKIGEFDKMHSPLEWQVTSRMLVVMSIEGLIFFAITVLYEYKFFFKPRKMNVNKKPLEDEDDDVSRERQRVLRGDANNDLLRLINLTKVYKTRKLGRQLAVDRLCLGIPQGECFGLLGVNGAGKTTTFKMLTGDELITKGDAYLNGHSISTDIHKVHQEIGYCPQFDALFDELTAREHLMLYARLRGVPPPEQNQVVNWALNKLTLMKYADKPACTYSGGNKRKLSTAIALLGHPPVIFMDEPTTGMDPHSRRFLWDLILDIIKGGRSVILTSHSMEECEALCTRLAIMVNGRFKCLGSIQHLKNRFGDGYTITVRVRGARPNLHPVTRFFDRAFPGAVLKEKHHNMVQYDLKDVSLSHIFAEMKAMEDVLNIEDYSVSQTTLDNVFINFAKLQCEGQSDEIPSRPSSNTVPTELRDLLSDNYLEEDEQNDLSVQFEGLESHLSFNMEVV